MTYRAIILVLCVVLSGAAAVLGLRTAMEAGPIWDDATEIVMMSAQIVVSSKPEISYQAAKAIIDEQSLGGGFYGTVFQFTAHALESLWSGKPWQRVEYTVEAIMWRHILCFILTVVAAGALAVTIRLVVEDWLLSAMTTAVLLSTPVFLGLSVIDGKDAPIMAGITLLSCGLSLCLWQLLGDRRDWWIPPLWLTMIFLGTLYAVGTRAGAIALVGVECAAVGTISILASRRIVPVLTANAAIGVASFSATALAIALNPIARKAPVQWILESVIYAQHPATQPLRVFGQTIGSEAVPWWYIPGWLSVEHPLPLLVLAAVGAVAIVARVCRGSFSNAAPWTPFAVQGLVLPLCIAFSGAVLHDRLRHLVFMVPPLCMVAAVGLRVCVEGWEGAKLGHRMVAIAGPICLLLIFASTAIWYPYQYAFLNEIGRAFPRGAFDTEVLGLSIHESLFRMKALGVKEYRAGPAPNFIAYDSKQWGIVMDYVSAGYPPHRDPIPGGGFYYLHFRPSWRAGGLPPSCSQLFTIERQGVLLGIGGQC